VRHLITDQKVTGSNPVGHTKRPESPSAGAGLLLSEKDKVDLQDIYEGMAEDEDLLAVLLGDNTPDNKKYKFDQAVDQRLINFVNRKFSLYEKLTKPNINAALKRQWFAQMLREVMEG